MKQLLRLLLAGCLLLPATTQAAPTPAPVDSAALMKARIDSIQASFRYQTGRITLTEGRGTFTVPAGMRYLDAAQSRHVLTRLWGNPESTTEGLEGMVFPADKGPLDEKNWAFIVSFESMGYVKDDDAEEIDYTELLGDMQQEIKDANPDRKAAGFPTMELLGWAAAPHYDKAAHALHWAKKIQFEGSEGPTLNYDVRILGRKGVLSLNAVANTDQLAVVQAQIPAVVKGTDFAQGQRYADFNPDIDEVAAYSLGGLVAGKVLAKVGAFALLAKFWKVLLGLLAAGFTAIRRFFTGRGSSSEDEQPAAEETTDDATPAPGV
ncbi:DUF2167 domain-containing protein [Hymenobacter gummosus]|uniref:DUF2167 domain-containing protein n=1 Tax=Hymenobacter gummosus TaxID=1776032 RepID=A0A431U4E1_9BACT|nr:DUF2167 domain-containing protein [Hymenobacter gummosus]RTQ50295.1 DUF2167 domain-containing protein [Hymenobacter gummosus]